MPQAKLLLSLAVLLLSTLTLASPSPAKVKDFPLEIRAKTCAGTPLTCGPTPFATSYVTSGKVVITTVITTTYVNPVTLPTTVMVPKSCHTFLLPVPQSDNDFCGPFTSKCGPAPACIVETTVTGPCKDPCCPCTQTLTTPEACKTCQVGCATQTKFVAQSTGCPA